MTTRKTIQPLRDKKQTKQLRKGARGRKLFLEQLEDRRLLASLYVDYSDIGEGGSGDGQFTSDGQAPVLNLTLNTSLFTSISAAVVAASNGDTIYVADGTYNENLAISKSLTLLGANGGKAGTAADRVSESLVQGFVDVTSGASAVSLDGFRFEKVPNTLYWNGTNVRMLASTSTLTNSIIEAGSAANYSNSGNTATLEGAVSTVTNNLFLNALNPGQQPNLLSVRNTTLGITAATITGNTFTQTGTTDNVTSIALVGQYGTVTIQNNTITGGGDGIFHFGLPSGGTIESLTVQGNTITDVGKNGLFLAGWAEGYYSTVNGGSVTGNAITGSGQTGSGFANIYIRPGNTVDASFMVSDNDLSSVAGSNKSVESGVSLNAENNWWGSASGPTHLSNASGTGSAVSNNVDFDPWIGKSSEAGTAGIAPNMPPWLFNQVVAAVAADAGLNTVMTTVSDATELAFFIGLVEGLTAPTSHVTIQVTLTNGPSYSGLDLDVPANVTLLINLGGTTLGSGSPALTVSSGQVIVANGTLTQAGEGADPGKGNFPTVLVESVGTLTLGHSTLGGVTINESDSYNHVAVQVDAGGTLAFQAGVTNTLNIVGTGRLIDYLDNDPLDAVGTVFQQNGAAIASNFDIEDNITHALDNASYGLVTWVANNNYVTTNTLGIQRGVELAPSGGTVNVSTGSYTGNVDSTGKAVILAAGTSPGQVTVTGNLTMDANDTLAVEIDGTLATAFDSWSFTGTTSLGWASIAVTGSHKPVADNAFTILSATGGVSNTFNGLTDGDTFLLNNAPLEIDYQNNAVVLNYDATPEFDGSSGNDSFFIRMVGDDIEIRTGGASPAGTVLMLTPVVNLTTLALNGSDGNDTLTVDLSGGNPIPSDGITFDGGNGGSDSIVLTGGSTTTTTYTFYDEHSGKIELNGPIAGTIHYDGLEPISHSIDSEYVVATYSSAAETITVSQYASDTTKTQIDSTSGETLIFFDNPSKKLTINGGGGNDTIKVDAFGTAGFSAAIEIQGQGDSDEIQINTNLALGNGTNPGDLTLNAETIKLNAASIATDGGSAAGSVSLTGAVVVQASVTVDTNHATGGDGSIAIVGATTIGDGLTLGLISGGGTIGMQSVSGIAAGDPSNLTLNSTNTISLTGPVGTDIGTLTVTNSGGATFGAGVGSSGSRIQSLVLSGTTNAIQFNGELWATSITNSGGGFDLNLFGSNTNVTDAVEFATSGKVTFGNGNDTLTFTGGVTHTAGSNEINGNIAAINAAINLNAATAVAGNRTLAAGSGQITLGATTLADGATLTLGIGGSGGVTVASLAGTVGGTKSNVTFNVGGAINVSGPIGTDIGNLTVTASGGTTFAGAIGASDDRIGTVYLTATNGTIEFTNDLYASSLTNSSGNFAINLFGSITNITNSVTFGTSGAVRFGNGGDNLTFAGGLTHITGANEINGNISTTNAAINLDNTTAATGSSLLSAGNGTITLGAATLSDGVTLTVGDGSATLIELSSISGVAGGAASHLTINTTAAATVSGVVGTDIGTLTLTNSSLATFTNTVEASGVTQSAGIVRFTEAVTVGSAGGTFDANVVLDGLLFTSAGDVRFGDAATDTLTISADAVTINTSAAAGAPGIVTVNSATTLGSALTISAGDSNIVLNGTVNGNHALVLNSSATTQINGIIGSGTPIASLTTDADSSTQINGASVATAGDQTYHDAVTLGANTTLTAVNVTFNNALNDNATPGNANLTVNASGVTTFAGAVGGSAPLTSLTTNVSGSTQINGGSVVTSGDQTYNDAVTLGANTTLTGVNVTFSNTLNDNAAAGNADLTVNASGVTTFAATVGGLAPLTNVTTNAGGSTQINGGSVATTGNQTYNEAVTLGTDTTLTGVNVTFSNTLNDNATPGGAGLVVNASGNVTFIGAVGGTARLGAISIANAANVTANAIAAASLSQTAGSGTTTLNGAVNTNAVAGVSLTGMNLAVNAGITTTTGGTVTFNQLGTVVIAAAGDINADGAVSITGGGGIASAGGINTTDDDVTVNSTVTLTGGVGIDTTGAAAGNILFNSTIATGGFDLALDAGPAGNVTFAGNVTGGGDLTIHDGAVQNYQGLAVNSLSILDATTSVTFNAATNITTNVAVNSGGTIWVRAKMTAAGTLVFDAVGLITIDGAIDPTTVEMASNDDIIINAAVIADNTITLQAGDDGTGSVQVTASGSLTTTAVGSDIWARAGTASGNIALAGSVSAQDQVTLTSLEGVSQTGGTLTSVDLVLAGAGAFDLNGANDVDKIAADLDAGSISFTDSDGIEVGSITATTPAVTVSGITTGDPLTGGTVTINATNGTILVSHAISTQTGTGGGITLTGAVTLNASLTAAGGNITLHGNTAPASDLIISASLTSNQAMNFTAPRDIIVDAVTQTTGAGSAIILTADSDADGVGGVWVKANGQVNSAGNATMRGSDVYATVGIGPVLGQTVVPTDEAGDSVRIESDGAAEQVLASGDISLGDGPNAPTTADTVVNGVVRTAGGTATIEITAEQDVRFGADGDVMGLGGTVTVTADTRAGTHGGQIQMNAGATITAGSGMIVMAADGNINLTGLSTTTEARVTTGNGAITDAGDISTDLTAGTAALRAATGIGTDANALDTAQSGGSLTLAAATESGGVRIVNSGMLVVGTVDGLSGVTITNGDGAATGSDHIRLVASSPLIVNAPVINNDGGNIVLTASGDTAADDLTLNAAVTATGGNGSITLNAGNDIFQNAGGNISATGSGAIDFNAGTGTADGVITQANGTTTVTATGLITLDADGNITIANLQTGNATTAAISITTTAGAVIDGGDANVDLIANSGRVVIAAVNGVGHGNALETTIGSLNVLNATANDIQIAETDAVTVFRAAQSTAGNIAITAASTITVDNGGSVSNAVTAAGAGTILLDANGANSDIVLNDGILSAGGDITLNADRNVTADAEGDITSTSGNLTVTADANTDNSGVITMGNGTLWDAGSGMIDLNAYGNVTLGGLLTTSSSDTAVTIDSTAGGVIDGGDTHVDIVANSGRVTITAATGIGAAVGNGADPAIETTIGTLAASVTAAGAIDIDETDAIVLLDVDTANGPITVDAGGQITATDVRSTTDADANDIMLRTTGGNIVVGLISAGTTAGDVWLNTPDAIEEDATADAAADIVAHEIELVAGTGIGNLAQLEINAVNLAAVTATGDINLQDTAGGLTITDVNVDGSGAATSGVRITGGALGHDIIVRASSPLTVASPVINHGGGNITLAAEGNLTTDDLTINASITASGGMGSIFLFAGDSISLAATVTVGAVANGEVLLSAGTNYNGGSAIDGNSGGDVTMASGSVVRSADGNIRLQAPNDVSVSVLNADGNNDNVRGNVTVTADYGGPVTAGGAAEGNLYASDGIGEIIDNLVGEAANIIAGTGTLRAASGIGSADDLETNIVYLDALNTHSGNIAINEIAAGGHLYVQQATHNGTLGSISLTTERGNITVLNASNSGVQLTNAANTAGTILLDANVTAPAGDEAVPHGNVVLNNVITSRGGSITINADHDVLGSAAGIITSNGGAIGITADANSAGPGGNDHGTIQLQGNIVAGTGAVTFSLADCDGWIGITPGSATGNVVSASNVIKNGLGALRLNGAANTYVGTTNVNAGTLLVNGTLTANAATVYVNNGGTLGGNGTMGTTPGARDMIVYSGGTLDPGDVSDGCTPLAGQLTVNGDVDVRSGGTFRVQLGGLTPGVGGYDQLVLNGSGNLNGSLLNGTGGGTLLVQPQFAVPVGAEFRIIDNDSTDLIDTRFLGLPEGAFLYPSGVLMNISYLSGLDSNDVTLTAPGRYDFNGFHGYTDPTDNYMPVSPFTEKTGANSAGWQTLPPRYFERSWPVEPPYLTADQRLKYDGHSTDRSGNPLTFEVDVVAGKQYEVMILTGDVTWNHDQQRFTVSGSGVTGTTQVVDTWGAGSPDGSGVNVTWGGGASNSDGTGFYRWIRFTTAEIAAIGLTELGKLFVTMEDLGGWDSTAVILAMDIRPVDAVGEITITRTVPAGADPLSALAADGMTVDTYQGTGAPPNATLTVTVSAGTPTQYARVTPDGDTSLFGSQVTANEYGVFTFSVLRPETLTNTTASPENWTILVEEPSGLSRGTVTQPYEAPSTAAPLRFDFGIYGSPVQAGFLQVIPQTTYNPTRGYGWTSRVAGVDRQDTINAGTSGALRTDLNYAKDATFKVDLPNGPNDTYSVRIYHSNPMYYGVESYNAGNFRIYAEGIHQYDVESIPAGTTDVRTFTIGVSGGSLEIGFENIGGWDGNFIVSGIEISVGALPGVTPLLASGNPFDSGAASITTADLAPVTAEATANWLAMGLSPSQAATLQNVRFTVADLGGAYLGLANTATNHVRIDDDAAMFGWSVNSGHSTAAGDPQSTVGGPQSTDGVDLLTVVMHELGHLLGYGHSDDEHDLMAPVLAVRSVNKAVEPRWPVAWQSERASSVLQLSSINRRASSSVDEAFADLLQDDRQDVTSELLETGLSERLASRTTKSAEQARQSRVPRRSRMERFERGLDAWFAQLAGP